MTVLGKIGDCVFMMFAYPCVVVYLFWCGDGSNSRTGEGVRRVKRMEKAMKVAMKERRKNEPSKLPTSPRSISYDLRSIYSKPRLFARPKQQTPNVTSHLLNLPLEIREQIYFEVLSQDTIHIVQLPKRLGHRRCTSSVTVRTHDNIVCGRECFNASSPIQTYRYGEFMDKEGKSENSLALLQTCSQIYTETSHILYRNNTFDINHPQTLIFLARTLPPSRLASIRNLNLTWSGNLPFLENDTTKAPDDLATWHEAWRIIGQEMTDLRVLKLKMLIYDDEFEKSRSGPFLQHARKRWCTNGVQFEKILEVMKENVRGLRDFKLGVELPEDVEWDVGGLEGRLKEIVCAPRIASR